MAQVPPIPDSIGAYRVLRRAAVGGTSVVYEVERRSSGERYALKLHTLDDAAAAQFYREYEVLARLNHPNVVRVFELGVLDGQPWFSMEMLAGSPLHARVRSFGAPGAPARTAEAVRILAHVADALAHLHRRGLVHRDIKSDNVLILPDGRVKLVDLGAAYWEDAPEPGDAAQGFVGTFAYASPEQFAGSVVDARSDLYNLGVLAFRLLSGQWPFPGDDPVELAKKHAAEDPSPLRSLVADLPEALHLLVHQLLAKRPSDRPAGAEEVARRFRSAGAVATSVPLCVHLDADRAPGRETEVVRLATWLERSDPGALHVVVGAEGSGRSRFVRAVANALIDRRSWSVITDVVAEVVSGRAFLEFIESESVDTTSAAIVDALRGAGGGAAADGSKHSEAQRTAIFSLLRERRRAGSAPILVRLTDWEHSGAETRLALYQFAAEVASVDPPIRFITDLSEAAYHGARRDSAKASANAFFLAPLSLRSTASFLGQAVHRRPPPVALAREIYAASGGHPEWIEAILNDWASSGRWVALGDRIAAGDVIETGDTCGKILRRDLATSAALPRGLARVLEALSLAGRAVGGDDVAVGMGLSKTELEFYVRELRARGLVVQDDLGLLRPSLPDAAPARIATIHPLRRRVLVERLSATDSSGWRAAWRHAALGSFAEAAAALVADPDPVPAADIDAVVLCGLIHHGLSGHEPFYAEFQLVFARVLWRVTPGSSDVFGAVERALQSETRGSARAEALSLLAKVERGRGRLERYRELLDQAWKIAEAAGEPKTASRIALEMAQRDARAGSHRPAASWLEMAGRFASQAGALSVVARAEAVSAQFLLFRGEVQEAERLAARSMERFSELGRAHGQGPAVGVWVHALRIQGRISEALTVLEALAPQVRDQGNLRHLRTLLLAATACELDLYRLGRAQEYIDELVATSSPEDPLDFRAELALWQGRVASASGRFEEAASALATASEHASAVGALALAEVARAAQGEALHGLGDRGRAQALLQRACDALQPIGDRLALADACAARVRCTSEVEDPDVAFRDVRPLVEAQGALTLALEFGLARARHLRSAGDAPGAFRATRDAGGLLNRIAAALDPSDQAALRIHPWAREVRRGLTAS